MQDTNSDHKEQVFEIAQDIAFERYRSYSKIAFCPTVSTTLYQIRTYFLESSFNICFCSGFKS